MLHIQIRYHVNCYVDCICCLVECHVVADGCSMAYKEALVGRTVAPQPHSADHSKEAVASASLSLVTMSCTAYAACQQVLACPGLQAAISDYKLCYGYT